MKILQLTYYDKKINWRLSPMHFSNLNLLVGISGVGKTQILKSIMNLRSIARGHSLNGVTWDVNFSINNNIYQWKGEFEYEHSNTLVAVITNEEELESRKFIISNEYLSVNSEVIIERNTTEIQFKGNKLPKLSRFTSAINILSEEEDIYPVKEGFNQLVYSDQFKSDYHSLNIMLHSVNKTIDPNSFAVVASHYYSLEKIKESGLPIQIKLALAYRYERDIFKQIKNQFINIFEQVEDVKLEFETDDNLSISTTISQYPFVQIKEKYVDKWIKQNQISAGMFKTLMHISELYLSANNTVILIDEFENSLGVNCIDVLSDLLITDTQLQFILTSHHPYVINKISMEYWKIVTRKGGVVTVKDMKEFNLPKSRHQAFMQLINLDAYREGIAV
ncbi:AAA family ATPase [Dulcicalothrix desertica]|nr:AAA family ATPase [Dulcicalothrix desertica]TWH50240.1 AAA15 family ATPase/GTPase [Dulcicalothrix desertica PCC 7102]